MFCCLFYFFFLFVQENIDDTQHNECEHEFVFFDVFVWVQCLSLARLLYLFLTLFTKQREVKFGNRAIKQNKSNMIRFLPYCVSVFSHAMWMCYLFCSGISVSFVFSLLFGVNRYMCMSIRVYINISNYLF